MKKWYRLLIVILLSLNSGCRSVGAESPTKYECNVLLHPFLQLTIDERVAHFATFDLDRQYVTYLCGMRVMHPQPYYLTDTFSKEGQRAFPFLAKKVIETKNDSYFRYTVYVLEEMQRQKTYDVVAEKDLMRYMEKRASEIQDEYWRGYTKRIIETIQSYSAGKENGAR